MYQICTRQRTRHTRLGQADLTRKRLERAAKLTSGLADEAVRWRAAADGLAAAAGLLVGDVFLAAGAIAYLGAFTGAFRWASHPV